MPLQATSGAATYDAFGVSAVSAAVQAEAIDFDGTNDFLSRSPDLVGNTNGKTFTFSAWVWSSSNSTSTTTIYSSRDNSGNSNQFQVQLFGNTVRVQGYNTSYELILQASADLLGASKARTFYHILISIDLANTANRSIYINDIAQSLSVSGYSNQNISFANSQHFVSALASVPSLAARFSNIYLDKTYRDLSITANRRLFVTADLKPAANQQALNPILYLPMSDPTQPGLNQGTGGNFTLNGVVARSGRGPNQYNAPYSVFDGGADFLNRTTALTGIVDGKQLTFNLNFSYDAGTTKFIVSFMSSSSFMFSVLVNGFDSLNVSATNAAGTQILLVTTPNNSIVSGRNYTLTVSIDLANTANRHVYLNGAAQSVTWLSYTDDNIDFNPATPNYIIGRNGTTTYFNGKIGAFWFNTSYIDLSVPANLAKFVTGTGINAKPVDLGATGELPTGTSPIIYLPMYGNNAGRNYGTGGDFTVNSGPYTGARGPNEYWGNRAQFPGTSGSYLRRTSALTGISNTRQFSCSMFFLTNQRSGNPVLYSSSSESVSAYVDTSGILYLSARNAAGTVILDANSSSGNAISDGTLAFVQICFDLTDSAKRFVYINGTARAMTWNTYSNADIGYTSSTNWSLGANTAGSNNLLNGYLSEVYLANSYIDFSQEAERLKFRDAFGNPTDLPSAITAATVPTPVIYMRFPPTAFGTNSGTGGNFTVNGTITDGGQL